MEGASMHEKVIMGADGLPQDLRWHLVLRPGSIFFGLLAGLGTLVLLQQYSIRPVTWGGIVLWLFIGLAVGILLPSLFYLIAVKRANNAIAEARQARQTGQRPPPPPAPPTPPQRGPAQ